MGVGVAEGAGVGFLVGFGVGAGFGVAAGTQEETPLPEALPATGFGARYFSSGSVPATGKSSSARARMAAKSAMKM